MVEPTETEGKAQMDEAIKIYKEIYKNCDRKFRYYA